MFLPFELSVQLYSLRHIPDLAEQLRLVREAGLTSVEATSSNYGDPERFGELCRQFGLSVPSGHVGIDRLRSDFEGTVDIARALGMRTVIIWGLPEDEKPQSADGWQMAGAELGAFADRLSAAGLGFAFHNHDWELQVFEDGYSGLDHLFDGAGNSPLLWQADLAWLSRGGADVEKILETHVRRLVSAHVKDMAPAGANTDEDGWADLGHGVLPWRQWWRWLRSRNIGLLVLEHDEPGDPSRFLARSADFARQLEASVQA